MAEKKQSSIYFFSYKYEAKFHQISFQPNCGSERTYSAAAATSEKMSEHINKVEEGEEGEPSNMVILQVEIDEGRMESMDIKEEEHGSIEMTNENSNVRETESVSEVKQEIVEDDSLNKFRCIVCYKRFATKINLKRHVSEVHERVKKCYCEICDKPFTRKGYLKHHSKHTKSHNRLIRDECQFKSFITGHYHYRHIWTPRVGEDLTAACECDNTHDEFAVSILKNNDTIVGHTPRQISKQVTALLKSAGTVNVKVIAKPVKTKTRGIRVPCTYIVSGRRTFVQDIKDNIHKIE